MNEGPIFIGATGGSGTRVVAELMANAGVFIGENLNHANDSMDLEPGIYNAINAITPETRSLDYHMEDVPAVIAQHCLAEMQQWFAQHLGPHDGKQRWGAKNPRSMFLVPLYKHIYPDMYFVHVVRDGRDIAFSENQQQANNFYMGLLQQIPPSLQEASIELWSKANVEVHRYGMRELKERYYLLHFEKLCADPEGEVTKLYAALGLTEQQPTEVKKSSSIDRYKQQDAELVKHLEKVGCEGLETFGYAA